MAILASRSRIRCRIYAKQGRKVVVRPMLARPISHLSPTRCSPPRTCSGAGSRPRPSPPPHPAIPSRQTLVRSSSAGAVARSPLPEREGRIPAGLAWRRAAEILGQLDWRPGVLRRRCVAGRDAAAAGRGGEVILSVHSLDSPVRQFHYSSSTPLCSDTDILVHLCAIVQHCRPNGGSRNQQVLLGFPIPQSLFQS